MILVNSQNFEEIMPKIFMKFCRNTDKILTEILIGISKQFGKGLSIRIEESLGKNAEQICENCFKKTLI